MLTRALALVMLFSPSLPLSAQSLAQTAVRERGRRETAAASPARVFTDEDLLRYAVPAVPEAEGQPATDQPPAAFDAPLDGEAPRQDAYGRHWTSAEAYFRQCGERLRAAKEVWLAASEASQAGATARARLAVEKAAGAFERAREYRNRAEIAARLAGALRAGLP